MKIKQLGLLTLATMLVTSLSGSAFAMETEERTLAMPAAAMAKFKAEVGAGGFRLVGDDNASDVTVVATIHAKKIDPDAVHLTLKRRSDHIYLSSEYDNDSWFGNSDGYIDIDVIVPSAMTVSVDDGSGNISISGTEGAVAINDGSGNIMVEAKGAISINDGSGDIKVNAPSFPININDGSGNIKVEKAQTLNLNDGSGDIHVTFVEGAANISDGSGNIYLKHIAGGSISDGSGDIRIDENTATLYINDGSGDIHVPDLVNAQVTGDGSGGVYVNGQVEVDFTPKHDRRLK